MAEGPRPPVRLPGLDLLRAVAIISVMITHAGQFGLGPDVGYSGEMGVDLFFALSGFLIGGQLFRPLAQGERPSYPNFFARRLLRTMPAYLVVLALYFAFPILWDEGALPPAWQFLTFTQNQFLDPGKAGSFSQAWSLCVEEQFYLLLPAVVIVLTGRARPWMVVATAIAVLAMGMILRSYLWFNDIAPAQGGNGYSPRYLAWAHNIYYLTWSRLDALLAGVCVALLKTFRPRALAVVTTRPNLVFAAGCAGIGAAMLMSDDKLTFWPTVFGFPLLGTSMGALVAAGSESAAFIARWAVPGAGALAAMSYSLYLSHKIVFGLAARLMQEVSPTLHALSFPLAFIAALALGATLYMLVERPFLKLRDRFRGPARPATAS